MRRLSTLLLLLILFSITIFAQIPSGYYTSAIGKKQAELKTALHLIIKTANVPSYGSGAGSTWAAFAKMDIRPEDGTVWDMYSNNHVAFNGVSAASGMNIEHSFAKSWWGDGRQAAQDVQHLCPSNSSANSSKGSWPMAVVDVSTSFTNGCIKVGKSSSKPGMTIDAWEPADEYKGDFARMYMYMVTAYEDYATLWTGNSVNQLDNNTYPVFEQWTVDMLLKWNQQDPVSQKEITRTNEAYKIQGNRNPFIDYPMLAEYIWGKLMTVPFTPDGNVAFPYLSTPSNGAIVDFGKVPYMQNTNSTIAIKAQNLTGDLTLAISGTDAANFTTNTTISKSDAEAGYNLSVLYSAQSIGAQTAQLSISGGGITPITVNLKAAASDEFLALPATNVAKYGFDANWTLSANATGYSLNVYSLKMTGNTQAKILLEEDFLSGLPTGWTSEGYTDNATSSNMRLASGSNPGKLNTPALDLSTSGTTLTVRARQYNSDAGAQLTATLDNQPLTVWTTSTTNQDFVVNVPVATNTSKISLSAATSIRVYVDYVKVQTQGSVAEPISVVGYPMAVGNVLSYSVSGLEPDSTYYYTITPEGNGKSVSNAISVKTGLNSGIIPIKTATLFVNIISGNVTIQNLQPSSIINLYDVMGKRLTTSKTDAQESNLRLSEKGIYFVQILQNNKSQTIKVRY
ncbi:MAG: endonuclease [Bacteroidales bacterium]|nr:endonuclease [Bacteroidales bacterium]